MRLVINADDFGWSPSVNAGILAAHDEGVLSSASVMAQGTALAEAAAAATSRPGLGIGLHLNLSTGRPILDPSRVPTLVDDRGAFLAPARLAIRLATGRTRPAELRAEIEAQHARVVAAGFSLDHVDGHFHIHAHPALFGIVAEAARDHGIRWVRVPSERFSAIAALRPANVTKAALLRLWCRGARATLDRVGLRGTDLFWGVLSSGRIEAADLLLASTGKAPTGEVCCHPGLPDPAIPLPADLHERFSADPARRREVEALRDARVRAAFAEMGVEVVRFGDLGP